MYRLGQSENSERGEKYERDKRYGASEESAASFLAEGEPGVGDRRNIPSYLLGAHKEHYHKHDAEDHNDSLNEVGEGGSEVSAEEEIERRKSRKAQHNRPTGDPENYFKET